MRKNLLSQPLFRITVPPVYGFMMYFLILLIMNNVLQLLDTMFTQELLICVILAYILSESVRFSTVVIERSTGEEFKKVHNLTLLFVVNILVGGGLVFLSVYGYFKWYIGYTSMASFSTELYSLVLPYSISALLYTLFYVSIYFLTQKNETELRQEDLKRQNLEHQLEIFNNEINPDLLFQSLETLISLVHHNQDVAEDFVDRLSLVYRYILDNRKRELITLKQEIAAVKNMFYLFKEKYPGQLDLEVKSIAGYENRLLVPNSMPLLLDCIVNGSIISTHQPLSITLELDKQEDYILLQFKENDKLSTSRDVKRRHESVHEAYAYFTDRPVIQIKAYGDVFMKLPLLDIN